MESKADGVAVIIGVVIITVFGIAMAGVIGLVVLIWKFALG